MDRVSSVLARRSVSQMMKTFWVISHRSTHDDHFFKYSSIDQLATSKHLAWNKFLKIVGKDRKYWNDLGYIAVPVKVTVTYTDS